MDPKQIEKLYSEGFLPDKETLARQAGENVGVTRVCKQDELVLCWRGEKHEASLVPGCTRSDTSKVQVSISALLDTDEMLLKDQAQM